MISISDKVVCVDDVNFFEPQKFTSLPQKGVVYVVRGRDRTPDKNNDFGIYLVGIYGTASAGTEDGFASRRFRVLADIQAENAAALDRRTRGMLSSA